MYKRQDEYITQLPAGANLALMVQKVGASAPAIDYHSQQMALPASTQLSLIHIYQVKLVGGNSYQFCWASYSSATAPSDWKAYYEKNPADQAKGDDGLPISEVATLTVTSGSKTDYDAGETTYPAWVNKQYALDEVLKAVSYTHLPAARARAMPAAS